MKPPVEPGLIKDDQAMKSGEQPLSVFVSSVMGPDMKWARDAVAATLDRAHYLSRWLFEYTPASSDTTDNSYLSKVRTADVVIWLVGDKTTEPVRNEIQEALSQDRRLWIFKLPATSRDPVSEALLKEVGLRAKWVEVKEQAQLIELLDLTLGDEIVRAMRNKPGMGRLARLEELGRASRARCIARWQSAGLSREEACSLADDSLIGDPAIMVPGGIKEPVCVICGDFGSGKSLTAERLLQKAIASSRDNTGAPIPVFLKALEALGKLRGQSESACDGLGNPGVQGAYIIVDGADEVGIDAASELLAEARILANTWPNTRVLVTSRPVGFAIGKDEVVYVEPLSESHSNAIIDRISGDKVTPGGRANWSEPISKAVGKPLFAVLMALHLRERVDFSSKSLGELLGWLVERALGNQKRLAADMDAALQKLAVLSTDSRNSPVHIREVVDLTTLHNLIDSRLVVQSDNLISFPLPVLAQWFAARALLTGAVSAADLAGNPARLALWYYPLIIAIGMANHDQASELLTPIAASSPALAAMICEEALAQWGLSDDVKPPPAPECGARILKTMQAWISGIGPLAKLTSPALIDGILPPLGVAVHGAHLYASWYMGSEQLPEVVQLSPAAARLEARGWVSVRSARPGRQPSWAWRWTLDELRHKLSPWIERKNLPISDGPLYREKMWNNALLLTGKGDLHYDPIPFEKIEKKLAEYAVHGARVNLNGHNLDLDDIRRHLNALKTMGHAAMECPYPGPDKPRGRWIWSGYSESQVLSRAKLVYAAATVGYSQLVAAWFPKFASRLELAAMAPVRAVGTIRIEHDEPRMAFHFEPLPRGAASEIRFSIGQDRSADTQQYEEWRKMLQTVHSLRPEIAEWCSYSFGGGGIMDIFHSDAATKLAYHWLKDDLRRIKWLD